MFVSNLECFISHDLYLYKKNKLSQSKTLEQEDLHKPSDDSDKINYQKIVNTVDVIEKLIRKIDALDHALQRN